MNSYSKIYNLGHAAISSLFEDEVLIEEKIDGSQFGSDKKILLGKHVSEEFKEVHRNDWKKSNPTNTDVLQIISEQYRSKARWNKAIQHLKERGELENSPTDIAKLFKEVQEDIRTECETEIKDQLYKWALPHIIRVSTKGIPEFYKEILVKKQFEEN